jgi:lysophospholipase L1-like esterase
VIEIRIIGDSSSSGIGLGKACYPYLLAKSPGLPAQADFRIVNYSVPGLTSADAAQLCTRPVFKGPFDYLVVYLGNNERTCMTRKGVPGKWHWLRQQFKSGGKRPLRPPHLQSHRHVFSYTLPKVAPNTPHEFERNLEQMIRCARRAGAAVVLINPAANKFFPSGIYSTNGVFFKYIGLSESTGRLLQGVDTQSTHLADAIRLQEQGRPDKARAIYEQLARSAGEPVAFIARHNLALCFQDTGKAIRALSALRIQSAYYESVVCYNLYQLVRRVSGHAQAMPYFEAYYELDKSTPRVITAYREVISRLSRIKGVPMIDLAKLLAPDHFVDYCHPTPDGHQRIAAALAQIIHQAPCDEIMTEQHDYENRFISPNQFFEDTDLVDYYQIDRKLSKPVVTRELKRLTSRQNTREPSGEGILTQYLIHFLNSNNLHPAFNPALDLLGPQAPQRHEILNFPEFYLYRLLYSYYAVFEKKNLAALMDAEQACSRLLLSASDLQRLILRHNAHSLDMELNLSRTYLRNIEWRLRCALTGTLFANQIGERIKTIRTWYTREAFRYGTHSRLSMLYDRWAVERFAEAVAIAAVVAVHYRLTDRLGRYGLLLRTLAELKTWHRDHAALYLQDTRRFNALPYEQGLKHFADRISGMLAQP